MTAQLTTPRDAATAPLPAPISWPRRVFKHPRLMHYNRLVAAVVAANVVLVWAVGERVSDPRVLGMAVLGNVSLAILIRQQYVINLLFRLATSVRTRAPLRLRWTLGKVYHFGGIHVGGALCGTAWYLALLTVQTRAVVTGSGGVSTLTVVIGFALLAVLAVMITTAMPTLRQQHHDWFERTHRFGGWTALGLVWAHTLLSLRDAGVAPPTAPEPWLLGLVTVSVALPWMRLRKVPVRLERPSNHVVLARFDHGETPFAGSSTAISRHPWREWHSFANVPTPGEPGFRLTISRAGDWTGSLIDDLPDHVWVKGITTAGVANIEVLFRRVVYVATGSGIGPCLPHLLAQEVPAHLVWATRNPRVTYGDALVDEILAVQPEATIWDTTEYGKPDMVQLAYDAYRDTGAEAVICISNKKLTWQVVHGLERLGIPAYGAIWDS